MVRFGYGPFWLWNETSCSVDTDSHKLKQLKVKIVIIICQTSNQSATMEQNYCSSVYFLTTEVLTLNVDTGLSATVL